MIIILNGPPKSGKDTIANYLEKNGYGVMYFNRRDFKDRIEEISAVMLADKWDEFKHRYNDRTLKETPWKEINYLTPRQFYIELSENFCKPMFGYDYFGKATLGTMRPFENFILAGSGFPDEIYPLLKAGNQRVCIVRLHKEGCTFEGDSRRYLEPKDLTFSDVETPEFIDIDVIDDDVETTVKNMMESLGYK